jgi:hypothetical protein
MPPGKSDIIRSIEARAGIPDLARILAERLSGTELNSLLMSVFDQRARQVAPGQLLQQYQANRYVQPAGVDMIGLLQLEMDALLFLRDRGFQPLELSPVAQFGSCSVVGPVSQDKILSALRDTEIMPDATNSLALHIAGIKKGNPGAEQLIRFCTVQRHLRTPPTKVKGHTPHFKIGCMVTAGRDTGDYCFERTQLADQLVALCGLLKQWGVDVKRIKLQRREGYADPDRLVQVAFTQLRMERELPEIIIDETSGSNNYYKGIQFKVIIAIDGQEIEIADGGLTNWTQQLIGNRKERLLVCGFGLEWLYKLRSATT